MSQQGRIVAVCIGAGGIPKQPVDAARVTVLGLEGDRHRFDFHGGRDRALCLLSVADYASLAADGVPTAGPGTFGENLLVDGIDFATLRPGDRLTVSSERSGGETGAVETGSAETGTVEIQLVDIREPCATLASIDRRLPDLIVGRSGFMARVAKEGLLRAGASIQVV